MRIRHAAPLVALVALLLALVLVPAALAKEQPFQSVKVR